MRTRIVTFGLLAGLFIACIAFAAARFQFFNSEQNKPQIDATQLSQVAPGSVHTINCVLANPSDSCLTGVQLALCGLENADLIEATPPPSSQVAGLAIWNQSLLPSGRQLEVRATVKVNNAQARMSFVARCNENSALEATVCVPSKTSSSSQNAVHLGQSGHQTDESYVPLAVMQHPR